jgi:hypothetical protein
MKEDGRKNNGGNKNAGRKPKVDELKFVEKLDNIINSDEAIEKLLELVRASNFNALKLYIEYRFGKPKETIENINHNFNQELTAEDAKKINDILEDNY